MKKLFAIAPIATAVSCLFIGGTAELQARPTYWAEFQKLYVVKDSPDPVVQAKSAPFLTAKCNVCHIGTSKKTRNEYANALGLTKADIKNTEKIIESLKKAADVHSKKDDDKSPTYGELINEGKLPCPEEKEGQ